MIRVTASRQRDRCRLAVLGHAGQGAERDAVCAGVSALSGALLMWATQSGRCRHVRQYAAPGVLFLSCRGAGDAFDAAVLGLRAIAKAYPTHLQVEISVNDKTEKA